MLNAFTLQKQGGGTGIFQQFIQSYAKDFFVCRMQVILHKFYQWVLDENWLPSVTFYRYYFGRYSALSESVPKVKNRLKVRTEATRWPDDHVSLERSQTKEPTWKNFYRIDIHHPSIKYAELPQTTL